MPGVLTAPGPKLLLSMTTHILNSAMMPAEGCYSLKAIDRTDFFNAIIEQRQEDPDGFFLRSWIGYEQNADLIEAHTGWRPPICRSVTQIEPGDRLLIMRLKYRVSTQYKGKPVKPEDFEYFAGYYTARPPVPSWNDLLSMDIYEPEGQRFLEGLYQLTGGRNLHALKYTRMLMQELPEGSDERWEELHGNYTDLLRMHFDPAGYLRQIDKLEEE